jgi:tripartite-type tricarboxylate transporter receptor subunit TctC
VAKFKFFVQAQFPCYPFVNTGKLQALAMTSPKRSSIAPNLPTIAESGYPDYQALVMVRTNGASESCPGMQKYIFESATKALQHPETIKTFREQGIEILNLSPSATDQFIRAEIDSMDENDCLCKNSNRLVRSYFENYHHTL